MVKLAVRYPVSILMFTLAVCLLGVISYNRLGTDLFPDLRNPSLYVELEAGERPPEEMEKQYVEKIEALAARQNGVRNVSSSSRTGYARIVVEYEWSQDMDAAFLDIQRSLSSFSQDENLSSLNVSRYDANAEPVMIIALTHREVKDMNELRKIAENYMRSELVRIDGVADIRLDGQEYEYIEVKTDAYMLDAFGLTVDGIAAAIENVNRSVSGGSIVDHDIRYTIKGVNLINSVTDISDIIVAFKEESTVGETGTTTGKKVPVYLRDVAAIVPVNSDSGNYTRFNGERCLGISIYKENKYNTVKVVEGVRTRLEELRRSMPGYEFHVVSDQGQFIHAAIGEVKNSALLGIALAVIVLYVFLRRLNTTLIVSISIPVSIVATFNLMYFNGLTINIMTLGGLALGAGMLVDNAIVVMENIFRNREGGLSSEEAAIQGTSEVMGAISSSTLTTIVVFLPIVYIQGAAGELFKEQAWTVTFSLLSSLFVALLLIPMLSARFLKKRTLSGKSIRINGTGDFIGRVLKYRYGVVGVAILLILSAYLTLPFIGKEFMPASESREFSAEITLPPGSSLETTEYASQSLESLIRELGKENIEWIYTLSGPSNTESSKRARGGDNQATIKVRLKKESRINADMLVAALNRYADTPEDVEVSYAKEQSVLQDILGTEAAPLVVEIRGDKAEVLELLGEEVKNKIGAIPGVYDVISSVEKGVPEINISVDRLRSGIYGIDIAALTQQVKSRLNGKSAGNFDYRGERVDIEVALPEVGVADLVDLEVVLGGKKYRLGELADIHIGSSSQEIIRNDQHRVVKIMAMLQKGVVLSEVTPAVSEVLENTEFPARYSARITGEEEKRAEAFEGLGWALLLSVLLVYMVMAAQFESLKYPFTVLLTIPLAGVGSILAFLLTGSSLNIMAFIGIIMLAGIAVNSSIILVDRINQLRAQGLETEQAIVLAVQQRIRPIIMTTLTTVLALLPMCFGFGDGASLRSPMALAVIGGLITSTAMTLIVIPCVYYILNRKNEKRDHQI